MRKKNYEIELFSDFQRKKRVDGEIICFNVDKPLFRKELTGLDFFSILLIEQGTGIHKIDQLTYPIVDWQIHFLFPGQLHSWDIKGEKVKIQLIFVSAKLFKMLEGFLVYPIEYYKRNPVIPLDVSTFYKVKYEFDDIKREVTDSNGLQEIVLSRIRIVTMLILRKMLGEVDHPVFDKPDLFFNKLSLLIMTHWRENRSVAFYAEKVGLTANYINVLCKKHLNITAISFIAKTVLNEVIHEMKISRKKIKDIAEEMQFNDVASFSNYFKRHKGISPREFLLDEA